MPDVGEIAIWAIKGPAMVYGGTMSAASLIAWLVFAGATAKLSYDFATLRRWPKPVAIALASVLGFYAAVIGWEGSRQGAWYIIEYFRPL